MSRLRLLVLLGMSLTVVALAGANTAGAVTRAGDPSLYQQLAVCKEDLAQARAAAADAGDFLQEATSKKLVLIPFMTGYAPVAVSTITDMLTLQLLTGKMSKAELKSFLQRFAAMRKATLVTLRGLAADARSERDRIDGRCAAIAKKIAAGESGGGTDAGASTGAGAGGGAVLRRSGSPTIRQGTNPQIWNVNANGSTATVKTPAGDAELRWTVPAAIGRSGAGGSVTVNATPGAAGAGSNFAAGLEVRGEVDLYCGGSPCEAAANAYTKDGVAATKTTAFTIKPRAYSQGRKTSVLIEVILGPNGPAIVYSYEVVG